MAIPVSTVPAVKGWLYDQLSSLLGAQNLLVSYGEPSVRIPDDVVIVGDVHRTAKPEQIVGSGGAGWLWETYTVEVDIDCYAGGADQQQVDQRAWQLVGQVEQTVRGDPTLGGQVIVAYPKQAVSQSGPEAAHKGRLTRIAVEIEVTAQI